MKLLIIGNGIAALSAAENFRKHDQDTEILMLSEDAYPTYYRIKLSHFLSKPDFNDEELIVKPEAWYEDRKIQVKLNTRVESIDFTNKEAVTTEGDRFGYDRLLLANGAHAFAPPLKGDDKAGVFTLRSLDDLKTIQSFLKGKERVIVIGGGLLGLEAAHSLVEQGKQVSVLEFFPYLLPRQLDQELSGVVQEMLEKEGLSFVLGTSCKEITGDQTVSGMLLENGQELKADAVILSIGIRPNTGIFKDSPLTVAKGVVVNERMQTNLPDVYAAGDIAEYQGTVFGLWTASNDQGKIAGTNLAGQDLIYAAPQLVATLNIGDVKLFSAGDVSEPESVITHRDEKAFHRLFVKGGRIVGAALIGDIGLMMKAKNLVLQKKEVPASAEEGDLFKLLMQ